MKTRMKQLAAVTGLALGTIGLGATVADASPGGWCSDRNGPDYQGPTELGDSPCTVVEADRNGPDSDGPDRNGPDGNGST